MYTFNLKKKTTTSNSQTWAHKHHAKVMKVFWKFFLSLSSLSHTNKLSLREVEKWRSEFYTYWRSAGFFFVLVWLVLFYCSDFIRLMWKIVFVFQICRLGFVFLFWLYVIVCNRWDREARESEERKRMEWESNNYIFIQLVLF